MFQQQVNAAIKAVSEETGIKESILSVSEIIFNAKHSISGKKGVTVFWWDARDHRGFSYTGTVVVIGTPEDDNHRVVVTAGISENFKEMLQDVIPDDCKVEILATNPEQLVLKP